MTHSPTRGTFEDKPSTTPHIHIAHPTPYWLASYPTTTHDGAICNLNTSITKEHRTRKTTLAQNKFSYVDKWLSNDQINQKLSNRFCKNNKVADAQISQMLTFRYAQYMGNHMKNIFGPSHTKTPTAPYAITTTKTHGPIFYHHVNTHT